MRKLTTLICKLAFFLEPRIGPGQQGLTAYALHSGQNQPSTPPFPPRPAFCHLTFIKYTAVAQSARAKKKHQREDQANIGVLKYDLLRYLPANLSSLELEEPSAPNYRPQTAEPLTLCTPLLGGADPSSSCSRTNEATHSLPACTPRSLRLRDGDIATRDVHVPCSDGTCARVAASLSRCVYQNARIKQLPKP